MHIFIKVGGMIKGRKIKLLYLLYIVFLLSFSQKFSRSLRSIVFYPPLKNASMQCALPTPFIYIFFIFCVIIPDCRLPKFTENMHKLHKIVYKMSKNCLREWGGGKGGGVVDVRLGGGRVPWLLGGIDAPVCNCMYPSQ